MKSKALYFAIALAFSANLVSAAPWTYRGSLNDGGEPANGSYDIRVSLLSEGVDASVTSPITLHGVAVKYGQFAVDVDFGIDLANAPILRLKTEVQQGGSGFVALGEPTRFDAKAALGAVCWDTSGNAGTNPATNFIGTTDAQPLVLRTRNAQSLRIEPSALLFNGAPNTANVIAGSSANSVTTGVRGATIAGGGLPNGDSDPTFLGEGPNRVTDAFGTVGGGMNNQAGDGDADTISSHHATVSGGLRNTASARLSVVGGGSTNLASAITSTVSGGAFNEARETSSTVSGGSTNVASAPTSTVGGGTLNEASGTSSTVSGGSTNVASAPTSTVGGGTLNEASGTSSTVSGGSTNVASAPTSTVGGGMLNEASGTSSAVSGGQTNCAGGNFSWAGGFRAKIRPGTDPGDGTCVANSGDFNGDEGTFVWADSSDSDFISTGPDQFLVRAAGGFGLNNTEIPPGVEMSLRSRANSGSGNVDIYLRPRTHERGINMAMLPSTTTDAQFRISQSDGVTFTDRLFLRSNGDFEVTAQAFKPGGGSWAVSSDARLKTDVIPLSGALDRLLQLNSVEYTYRNTDAAKRPAGRHIGFIAQEVAEVFPAWVSTDDEGFLAVAPQGFEALTVEGLRELQAENATLRASLAALEARLGALESGR